MNISCHFIEIVAIDAPLIITTMASSTPSHCRSTSTGGDGGDAKPPCASTGHLNNIHISVQKLQMMKLHLRHCKSMIKPIQSQPNLLLSLLIHISVIAVVILLCWERQRNQQRRQRHRYPPTN